MAERVALYGGTIASYPIVPSGLTRYVVSCRHGEWKCAYFDPGTAADQTKPTDLFLDLIDRHDRQWPRTDCLVEAEGLLLATNVMGAALKQEDGE